MEEVNVVLDGHALPGIGLEIARARLARLLKRDEALAATLLGGRRATIKSNIDPQRGDLYLKALRDAGVSAHLEPSALVFDESAWSFQESHSAAAPGPAAAATSIPPPRHDAKQTTTGLARLRNTTGWAIAVAVVGIAALVGVVGRLASMHWPTKVETPAVANVTRTTADEPKRRNAESSDVQTQGADGETGNPGIPPTGTESPDARPREAAREESSPGIAAVGTDNAGENGYDIDRIVSMREPTELERNTFADSPAMEFVGEDSGYVVAQSDIDDDGTDEFILSGFRNYCGSGGCSTVVLKRVGGGFEMFELSSYTAFANLGRFAVLKQKRNGFRLLAETDGGKIIVGDKPGTPLHGKPLSREVVPARTEPPRVS